MMKHKTAIVLVMFKYVSRSTFCLHDSNLNIFQGKRYRISTILFEKR